MSRRRVGVIGAGWAGLSCAHHLEIEGCDVTIFDAAPQPGGRARSAHFKLDGQTLELDNGQHMMIGAYRESLALIELCHGTQAYRQSIDRHPLQFVSEELSIKRRGPGRIGLAWGLLTGKGIDNHARAALLRFGLHLGKRSWTVPNAQTVATLLDLTKQPPRLVDAMWRPLCVAALNTEPHLACAQTFVNVLRDSLFLDGKSSDFLVAQIPLGRLLPEPLLTQLKSRGVRCHLPSTVRWIELNTERAEWQVSSSKGTDCFDAIVLATPPATSARLISDTDLKISAQLASLQSESIRTVYMIWDKTNQPSIPSLQMLTEDPEQQWFGQWIFERGSHNGQQVAAVVVSAASHLTLNNRELGELIARQVSAQLNIAQPSDAVTVNERNATFLCTPSRPVFSADHAGDCALPHTLALAGDYCYHRYPATLEAAVISGRLASERIARSLAGDSLPGGGQ